MDRAETDLAELEEWIILADYVTGEMPDGIPPHIVRAGFRSGLFRIDAK